MLKYICLMLCILVAPFYASASETGFSAADKYELKGGDVLLYDQDYTALALQRKGGEPEILSDYCSYPAVAPARNKFVFLEPWGFEEVSGIYMTQAGDNYAKTVEIIIPEIPERDTPKEILWLDDRFLLVIAGFADGTVTAGGNLYFYDNDTKTSGKVITAQNQEINKIAIENGKLRLTLVGNEYYYIVANYVNILRDTDTTELPLTELRRLINAHETLTLAEPPEKHVLYRAQALAGWLYGKILEKHGFDPVEIIIKQPRQQ